MIEINAHGGGRGAPSNALRSSSGGERGEEGGTKVMKFNVAPRRLLIRAKCDTRYARGSQ